MYPLVTWEFTVSDTHESLLALQQFHDNRFGGLESFYWTDKAGTQHIVKFAEDSQEITEIIGYDDYGNLGILGYSTTVKLRKVW
jgi:phage-related protein